MDNINTLKYKYKLAEFLETRNPAFAIEICDMLASGSLKISGSTKDGKLLFIIASRYKSKCCKCQEYYAFGDSIFVRNQKAWHVRCAEDSDYEHTYFQECVSKGLVDGYIPRDNDNDEE